MTEFDEMRAGDLNAVQAHAVYEAAKLREGVMVISPFKRAEITPDLLRTHTHIVEGGELVRVESVVISDLTGVVNKINGKHYSSEDGLLLARMAK